MLCAAEARRCVGALRALPLAGGVADSAAFVEQADDQGNYTNCHDGCERFASCAQRFSHAFSPVLVCCLSFRPSMMLGLCESLGSCLQNAYEFVTRGFLGVDGKLFVLEA